MPTTSSGGMTIWCSLGAPFFVYGDTRSLLWELITDEDIGGSIAFGAGIGMINVNVFKQLPRPWFSSTGCGEDWFFCLRCHEHGIRRYVDTGIDIGHKSAEVVFKNKAYYHEQREKDKELYEDRIVKQQEELEYYGR